MLGSHTVQTPLCDFCGERHRPDLTLVQAMRAAALGMQTAGLDPYGNISHALADGAGAIEALTKAVNGCNTWIEDVAASCGERGCGGPLLCPRCYEARKAAIKALVEAAQ